jgi:phytoene dehydrogenase-like protein
VTVFEEADQPGGLDENLALMGANHLPGDHLVWGWRNSRSLLRLFGSLRDRPGATARHLFQSVPTGFQVLGHPHRLDWGGRLDEEVAREFPEAVWEWKACRGEWEKEAEVLRKAGVGLDFDGSAQEVDDEAREAELEDSQAEEPPEGSQGRRSVPRALVGKPFLEGVGDHLHGELRDCLRGVALAVSWRAAGEVLSPSWFWAMELLIQEAVVLKDGLEGLVHWLAGRLEAAGGSLRLSSSVRTIKIRGRKVNGIVFKEGRGRDSMAADAVVVAGGEVSRLLPWGRLKTQKRRSAGTLETCLLAVEREVVAEPLAPLAAYISGPDQPVLLISHNAKRRLAGGEDTRHLLTVAWRTDGPEACQMELAAELPKRLERLMPFLPGRWELVAQDEATGSPLRRHQIPEVGPKALEPTTRLGGLVVASRNLLPGMATTASLTLGVEAAETVLKKL